MQLGATIVNGQSIPQYPWNVGDILYASALNAAIANNMGAPGAQGPPGPPGNPATSQWQAGVVTSLSPRVLLGGGVLDIAQQWVAGPVSYIGTGLMLQNGLLSAPAPGGIPAGALPTAGGTMTGPLFYTATGATTARSAQDRAAYVVSVLDFGALCNGSTDDTAAVNAALNSGAKIVTIPQNAICYLPNGITVPCGVYLRGMSFQPNNPAIGTGAASYAPNSVIMCGPNVNCITLAGDGNGAVRGTTVSDLLIATNNASAPTAGAGVLAPTGYNVRIERVMVYNCFDGYHFANTGSGGISGWLENCFSGKLSGHHVVVDGYPELHIHDCRFGMNGAGDTGALAYLYMTGGGNGTVQVTNCQFNEFNNIAPVGALLAFGNLTSTSGSQLISLDTCHAEAYSTAIQTDATATTLSNISLSNCSLWMSPNPFFSLNAATTTLTDLAITGCSISCNNFTLNNIQLNNGVIAGNIIYGNVTLGAGATGTLAWAGNNVQQTMIANGNWTSLFISGVVQGAFSAPGTGHINAFLGQYIQLTSSLSASGAPPQLVLGSNTSATEQRLLLNSAAGQIRDIGFQTAGNWRWWMGANGTAEGGSNAGSDFVLNAFNDAGTLLSTPITVTRATGNIALSTTTTTLGSGSGPANLIMNGGTANNHMLFVQAAGVNQWALGAAATADLTVNRYVSGTLTDTPLVILNASGALALGAATGPTLKSGTGAATGTQPKGSLFLRTDGAVGSTLYVSQGGGTWNAVANV